MELQIQVRPYQPQDIPAMAGIWNEIVTEGVAFPQEDPLEIPAAAAFFEGQSHCAVAEDPVNRQIMGLYILHPNNEGRCGHICNASYAVSSGFRGPRIGEKLVLDCMAQAKILGFRILQFNAVVASNLSARRLYERLGFQQLGTIPDGFRLNSGQYEAICPYFISL